MNKKKKDLYDNYTNDLQNKAFDEGLAIFKLADMLNRAKIPYKFFKLSMFSGWQIVVTLPNDEAVDVIQHPFSIGWNDNLLEICGGLTKAEEEQDFVLGSLTAEEVFERFKYCYENKTTVYKKP